MFIHSFKVKNFMIHQETAVDFFPITVLVGPNGGGKSALFDALLNFSMVSRGNIAQAFGPWPYSYHARRHHGTVARSRISYEALMSAGRGENERLCYHIEYSQQGVGDEGAAAYTIHNERLDRTDISQTLFDRSSPEACKVRGVVEYIEDDRSLFAAIRRAQAAGRYEETDPLVTYCARQISRFNKFRLDPTVLARPGRLPETVTEVPVEPRPPRLDYRGEDLAAVLYYLSEADQPALDQLLEQIREVVSGFQEFEFNKVGADRIGFSAKFADNRGTVPAAHLSDGVLTLIGQLVLVGAPDRPPVLCIEEPENGLTPQATKVFYKAVRDLAFGQDPSQRSQVVLSSHSPFVICEAWNGEDRNFIYQVQPQDGRAVIRPFARVVQEEGIHLRKDDEGKRTIMGLNLAEQIMSGRYS